MDDLFTGLRKLAAQEKSDFQPATAEEQAAFAFFEASWAFHRGNRKKYTQILVSTAWQPGFLRKLLNVKRLCMENKDQRALRMIKTFQLQQQVELSPGPRNLWQIELLICEAGAHFALGNFSQAQARYLAAYDLSQAGYHGRAEEALINFGAIAAYQGNVQDLNDAITKLRRELADWEWNRNGEIGLLNLESLMAGFTGDPSSIAHISDPKAWPTHWTLSLVSKMHLCADAFAAYLRAGWLDAAMPIYTQLRATVKVNRAIYYKEIMLDANLQLAYRTFDFPMISRLAAALVEEPKASLAAIYALALTRYAFHKGDAQDRARAREAIARAQALGAPFFYDADLELAKERLHLCESNSPDWPIAAQQKLRELLIADHTLAARERWWLGIETLAAARDFVRLIAELFQFEEFCRSQRFHWDSTIARILRQHLNGSVDTPEKMPSGIPLENASGVLERLLQAWPWNLLHQSTSGRSLENRINIEQVLSRHAPESRKLLLFMQGLARSQGEFVSLDQLATAIWQEAYDPRIHLPRLYNLAACARSYLRQHLRGRVELVSAYAEGYALRESFETRNESAANYSELLIKIKHYFDRAEHSFHAKEIAEHFQLNLRQAQRALNRLVAAREIAVLREGRRIRYCSRRRAKKLSA